MIDDKVVVAAVRAIGPGRRKVHAADAKLELDRARHRVAIRWRYEKYSRTFGGWRPGHDGRCQGFRLWFLCGRP